MTDIEINTAIAEAFGLNRKLDYCHDLNAMHEVELVFFDVDKVKLWGGFSYLHALHEVVKNGRVDLSPAELQVMMVRADARQRATAALCVKGFLKKRPGPRPPTLNPGEKFLLTDEQSRGKGDP